MSAGAIAGMRERDTLYLMLAGIFIASLVSCNLIFQKFFAWTPLAIVAETFPSLESALPWSGWRYKIELSVGILPYPVTFLCTDVISELYGKKNADRVVVSGLIASVFILGVVWLATATTAAEWSPVQNDTFSRVFGLAPWFVSASMIAYLTAQFIDIRIFHFFKRLTRGRHLWLRNNASTICSQIVDTTAVLGVLCIAGAIAWDKFESLLYMGVMFKVFVALLDTPFFYLAVRLLRPRADIRAGEAAID